MPVGFLKVTAIGNLGRDPEKRYSADGKPNTRFSLAATKRVRNRNGEFEDETDWLSCILFGRQAEYIAENVTKGMRVYVEGRLHKRDYKTDSGSQGSSLDVIVSEIHILTPRERSTEGSQGSFYSQGSVYDDDLGPAQPRTRPAVTGTGREFDSSDLEDLPF